MGQLEKLRKSIEEKQHVIINNVSDSFGVDDIITIEKAAMGGLPRGAQVGTQSRHKDGSMWEKTGDGWKPVTGGKKQAKQKPTDGKKGAKPEDAKKTLHPDAEKNLTRHAATASTESLNNVIATSKDEHVKNAAQSELDRREGDSSKKDKKEQKPKKKEVKREAQWYDSLNGKHSISPLPVGLEKKDVEVYDGKDTDKHWVMRWKHPKTGEMINAYSAAFHQRNSEIKWERTTKLGGVKFLNDVKTKSSGLMKSGTLDGKGSGLRIPLSDPKNPFTMQKKNGKYHVVNKHVEGSGGDTRTTFGVYDTKEEYIDKINSMLPDSDEGAESGSIEKEQQTGAILKVIAHTGLRVGSEEAMKKTGNQGVSTLTADSVTVNGDTVILNFIGKSHKENYNEIEDKELAEYFTKAMEGKGDKDRLFDVSRQDVMDSFREGMGYKNAKVKDIRTVVAGAKAAEFLMTQDDPPPMPDKELEAKKLVKSVLKKCYEFVSQNLNNTPAMAQKSYVNPNITDAWLEKMGASDLFKAEEAEIVDDTDIKDKKEKKSKEPDHLKALMGNEKPDEELKGVPEQLIEDEDEDDESYPLPDWWEESELEMGKEIESEHAHMYEQLTDYFNEYNKLPPVDMIYEWIAEDHMAEGNPMYYTNLAESEAEHSMKTTEEPTDEEVKKAEDSTDAIEGMIYKAMLEHGIWTEKMNFDKAMKNRSHLVPKVITDSIGRTKIIYIKTE